MRVILNTVIALTAMLTIAGCGSEKRQAIVDTFPFYSNPAIQETRRILIPPAFRAETVGKSSEAINQAMASAWRELGQFEIVSINEQERDKSMPTDSMQKGTIDSEVLRHIRVTYGVDAVLISRIEFLNSYDPVAVGLQAVLIDCGDGTMLWSGGGHFDSQRADVQTDIKSWHEATIGTGNSHISGWRNTLQSPRLFSRYVCDRLASTAFGKEPQPASGLLGWR